MLFSRNLSESTIFTYLACILVNNVANSHDAHIITVLHTQFQDEPHVPVKQITADRESKFQGGHADVSSQIRSQVAVGYSHVQGYMPL